jgi:hypothetical protein
MRETETQKSCGLLDIQVGMIERTYGEVVEYVRIADHATITFADGTVKRVSWGWRFYPKAA